MFGNWLNGVEKKIKAQIRMRVSAFCWAIWNHRNDIIFNRSRTPHFLEVIFKVTHWIRLWALLVPVHQRAALDTGCSRLEMVSRDIFNRAGWRCSSRLEA